jgi:hypothetical protein
VRSRMRRPPARRSSALFSAVTTALRPRHHCGPPHGVPRRPRRAPPAPPPAGLARKRCHRNSVRTWLNASPRRRGPALLRAGHLYTARRITARAAGAARAARAVRATDAARGVGTKAVPLQLGPDLAKRFVAPPRPRASARGHVYAALHHRRARPRTPRRPRPPRTPRRPRTPPRGWHESRAIATRSGPSICTPPAGTPPPTPPAPVGTKAVPSRLGPDPVKRIVAPPLRPALPPRGHLYSARRITARAAHARPRRVRRPGVGTCRATVILTPSRQ